MESVANMKPMNKTSVAFNVHREDAEADQESIESAY